MDNSESPPKPFDIHDASESQTTTPSERNLREQKSGVPPPIPPKPKRPPPPRAASSPGPITSGLASGVKWLDTLEELPMRARTSLMTTPPAMRRTKSESIGSPSKLPPPIPKRPSSLIRRRAVGSAENRQSRRDSSKFRWTTRKTVRKSKSDGSLKSNESSADPHDVFFGDGLFDLAEEHNEEIIAFRTEITELRRTYQFSDPSTNPSHLTCAVVKESGGDAVTAFERQMSFVAARASSHRSRDVMSIELVTESEKSTHLTCSRSSTGMDLLEQIGFESSDYALKVCGRAEYLNCQVPLEDITYILDCWRLNHSIRLVVVHHSLVPDYFSRTSEDDEEDGQESSFQRYYEQSLATAVSKRGLAVLMEAFQRECGKLREAQVASQMEIGQVVQTVKAICAVLSKVEPSCVTEAVEYLRKLTRLRSSIRESKNAEEDAGGLQLALTKLTTAVHTFINIYCSSFDTDFNITNVAESANSVRKPVTEIKDQCGVKMCSASRIPFSCKSYDYFQIESGLYYGAELLCPTRTTWHQKLTRGFSDRLSWEEWEHFDISLCKLPRETRLCVTLFGYKGVSGEDLSTGTKEAIGWVGFSLFNFRSELNAGHHLLGLWSGEKANPMGTNASNLLAAKSIILHIEVDSFGCSQIFFPNMNSSTSSSQLPRPVSSGFSIDSSSRHALKMIVSKDLYANISPTEKALLWSNRHSSFSFLHSYPRSLPILLTSVPSWSYPESLEVYNLVQTWDLGDPINALELLNFRYPDAVIRGTAIKCLLKLSDEDFSDYLPQLVQALKYESYHDSALARLLIERSLKSGRVSHHLFWELKQNLSNSRFSQRFAMTWAALLSTCGAAKREHLLYQEHVVELLSNVAETVKAASGSMRQSVLVQELQKIAPELSEPFSLPLNPGLEVDGIDISQCGYFNSNTVPLRLVFKSSDPAGDDIQAIFKVGDDLRQDALVIQMLRIMDKLWLREGVDLRIVTYGCVATAENMGMLEMVTETETLGKIQTQSGVTGSFKDRPLADWLLKHNGTEAMYEKAVENFTLSCAGYCVATYVLGICDRHNDNIMIRKTGHMFHIDFGKILGNAQMFGAIKRDRAPFVLTPDMAYVINGSGKPSSEFQHFVDIACKAFNVLRRHSGLFINLFSLMLSSGMPELTSVDNIRHVRDALLPNVSDAEATSTFTKLIGESLGSLATQLNFFIHNLAQMRFSGTIRSSGLFSFIPLIYTRELEGEITSVEVTGFEKRVEPVKFYVYVISVTRKAASNGADSPSQQTTVIYRRFREFHEFHTKLVEAFPGRKFPTFPSKIYMGRSHTRQVSEKRRSELNDYLRWLLAMDAEVSKSDYVYSFLHCLIRDEQDRRLDHSSQGLTLSDAEKVIAGEVKLCISYDSRKKALTVMVVHCRGLMARDSNGSADPYVKMYLLPDANKSTKRKTKVVKKSLNPTYNESFHYQIAFDQVARRTLQCAVWDYDRFSGNEFMGCVLIDLSKLDLTKGHEAWHKLEDMSSTE